jgi:hypothetical protein
MLDTEEMCTDKFRAALKKTCEEMQRVTRMGGMNTTIGKIFSFPGETAVTLKLTRTVVKMLRVTAADNTPYPGIGIEWHVESLELRNPGFRDEYESGVRHRTGVAYNQLLGELLPSVLHGNHSEYVGR